MGVHARQAARRASLAQGAGLLRAAQAMFPLDDCSGVIVGEFRALVRGGAAFQGMELRHIFFRACAFVGVYIYLPGISFFLMYSSTIRYYVLFSAGAVVCGSGVFSYGRSRQQASSYG